jgi:hypothetical protein
MGSPVNLKAQGDAKSSTPQTRLIQSWTFFSPPRNEALFAISKPPSSHAALDNASN